VEYVQNFGKNFSRGQKNWEALKQMGVIKFCS